VHTSRLYREGTQRVNDASSINAVHEVLASVRASSRSTSLMNQPAKRSLSCSSQSKAAPVAKAVYPWRPTLSQASSSRDGGHAASQQPDLQPTASDTPDRDWRATSSWDHGQVALMNYVNQQPAHQPRYYQSDYQSAYFQGPAKPSSYKDERKNDTASGSDPWSNWKPSNQWKDKRW
jgi:hypothetical protein